jgi:hypothetical protein
MRKFALIVALCVCTYAQVPTYSYAQELGPVVSDSREEMVGRAGLRRAIIQSGRKAVREGSLNRSDFLRIRVGTLAPAVLKSIEDVAIMQMLASGDDTSGVLEMDADGKVDRASIDWEKLLEFIERLLPIILQIISIFGG